MVFTSIEFLGDFVGDHVSIMALFFALIIKFSHRLKKYIEKC